MRRPPGPEHRGDVRVHADQHEEDRDEHGAHAVEIGRHPLLLATSADCQPGHERADDEGQLGGVGENGEAEDHDECNDSERGTGAGDAVDEGEEPRDSDQPDEPSEHQEADRPGQCRADGARADAAAGHHLDDDREDDEADDVVGDCSAEDDTSLGRRQCPQISEDARRDPDARRREGSAKEDRDVGRLTECSDGAAAEGEGYGHPDDGDEHGRAPDATKLGEVHLHADLDEQQQHADLGDHCEADAPVAGHLDETQHRRSDDDAGDDLAEDGGDADSLRQLGRQLGGGEDDEQVEEEAGEIDDRRGGEHAQRPAPDSRAMAPGVASSASIQPRRRTVTMESGPSTRRMPTRRASQRRGLRSSSPA